MKRHLLTGAVCLVVLVLYSWLIAPIVTDLREDWAFLHSSREYVIQQQLAAQKK